MELDELKQHLIQKMDHQQTQKSSDEIAVLLTKRAISVIDKLKRSLLLEIWFTILFTIAFIAVGFTSKHWSLRVYFSVFSVFCLLFGVVLYLVYAKTKQLSQTPSLPIKNNLQKIHAIISVYKKRYFQFTMALIPITMAFAFWLGYTEGKQPNNSYAVSFTQHSTNFIQGKKQLIVFIAVYIVVFGLGIYYFTKWYLRKLYGRYLEQLNQLIQDLESA